MFVDAQPCRHGAVFSMLWGGLKVWIRSGNVVDEAMLTLLIIKAATLAIASLLVS
jgi:hypothetical protein